MIGAIIMVHGDDQGLVLPPKLAPYQVVIVPIFKTDEEKASVLGVARKLKADLAKANIRVTLDEREGNSAGWKFNDWEMRGVPLRVELGPKDVAKQAAVLCAARPARTRRKGQRAAGGFAADDRGHAGGDSAGDVTTRRWRSANRTRTTRRITTS